METALTRLVIIKTTRPWAVIVIKAATRAVVIMKTAFTRLVVVETTAWAVVIVKSATRTLVIIKPTARTVVVIKAATWTVVVIETTARTVAKLAVAMVVIKSAFTSRLVAKSSLFASFLVTVAVIEFEGLSLLELFRFPNSGARTLARSFVVSHLINVLV
jgi:hypothetical protein